MARRFWPIAEPAQADYERLREAALAGIPLLGGLARRFETGGLAGLIVSPASEPVFAAKLVSARRPPWTPVDPRLGALATAFELLASAESGALQRGVR